MPHLKSQIKTGVRPHLLALAAVIAACTSIESIESKGLYQGVQPRLAVLTDRTAVLTASDDRPVPLSISFPDQGGPYPLIVLSHGTFSSPQRYDLISEHWAGQGYVVVLPQHRDANYGVQPTGFAMMQNVAMSRVADMSLVLDELDAIEQQVPELSGKIDHRHYIAAGHSIGTQVAMLVTGMQFTTPFDGVLRKADEDRFTALVLISDPGKMRMMPESLWLASDVPTFMATGTEDYGLMGQRGEPTGQLSEVMPAKANVDRYLLLMEGSDHYFGGLIQKEVDADSDYEGLAIFNNVSTAFLDAYTKQLPEARSWLQQVDMPLATQERATLEIRRQMEN